MMNQEQIAACDRAVDAYPHYYVSDEDVASFGPLRFAVALSNLVVSYRVGVGEPWEDSGVKEPYFSDNPRYRRCTAAEAGDPEPLADPMADQYDAWHRAMEAGTGEWRPEWGRMDADDRMTLYAVVSGVRDIVAAGRAVLDAIPVDGKPEPQAPTQLPPGAEPWLPADHDRFVAWLRDPDRKPANAAFTAGAARQAGYAVESSGLFEVRAELDRIKRGDPPSPQPDIGDPFTLAQLADPEAFGDDDLHEEYDFRIGPVPAEVAALPPVQRRARLVDALARFATDYRPGGKPGDPFALANLTERDVVRLKKAARERFGTKPVSHLADETAVGEMRSAVESLAADHRPAGQEKAAEPVRERSPLAGTWNWPDAIDKVRNGTANLIEREPFVVHDDGSATCAKSSLKADYVKRAIGGGSWVRCAPNGGPLPPEPPTPGQRFAATFIRASREGSDRQPCLTVEQVGDAGVENAVAFGYLPVPGVDVPGAVAEFVGRNLDRFVADERFALATQYRRNHDALRQQMGDASDVCRADDRAALLASIARYGVPGAEPVAGDVGEALRGLWERAAAAEREACAVEIQGVADRQGPNSVGMTFSLAAKLVREWSGVGKGAARAD